MTGQEGGEGGRPGPTSVGVVGQALSHQQGPEIGITDTELTKATRVVPDLLRRVVRVADEDLLRGEHDLRRGPKTGDVKSTIFVEIGQKVETGQIAGRIIDVKVLAAGIAAVDAARVRRRVPLVDGRVELQAGVGALPCRLGDLVEEGPSRHGLHPVAGGDGAAAPMLRRPPRRA